MSTTSLSDSREVVERSLYHSIRQEIVDKGYFPDTDAKTQAPITALNQLAKTFTVTGNVVAKYAATRKFSVIESTGNNATYTVSGTPTFAAGSTTITVLEAIPNATANGKVSIYTYYDDTVGKAELQTAITAVVTAKKFAIEIFGVSSPQKKYANKVPRIVIISNQTLPGSLGGSPDRVYTANNGDVLAPDAFTAKILPPQTSDFTYDIYLVSNSAEQSRILHGILALAIPKRGYVKFYNDSESKFFVKQYSYRSNPALEEGIMEDIYMYQVTDIFETEDVTVKENIKPIVEITLDTNEGVENKSTKFNDKIITP